jgi:hypothetical protein
MARAAGLALAAVILGQVHPVFSADQKKSDDQKKSADQKKSKYVSEAVRMEAIRRAQVWMATDVASKDLRTGPPDLKGFAPDAVVPCNYVEKRFAGNSPKFECEVADDDEVKVKFGKDNGEVYAEVAATRLLWALGFGADHMFPVKVECHGCPKDFKGARDPGRPTVLVSPASIERKMPGHAIETKEDSGWAWPELNHVEESAGGAPRAQIDALRLLAVFLQHTDSKPAQQRIVCLSKSDDDEDGACTQPFMMLNDVGLTFGHANKFNRNGPGSANFEEWSRAKIWSDAERCETDLSKSFTGTLDHPVVGEAGRKFLADLMVQLSDAQLHDLFDAARIQMRSPQHSVDEWVDVFRRKRDEIVNHTCPAEPVVHK